MPPNPTPPKVTAKREKKAACFQSDAAAAPSALTAAKVPNPANGSRNSTPHPSPSAVLVGEGARPRRVGVVMRDR